MRRYSCSDQMCGAYDCARCYPELQQTSKCACCGSEHALHEDWYGIDGDLCADCSKKVPCAGCGEWFDIEELYEEGFCMGCLNVDMVAAG